MSTESLLNTMLEHDRFHGQDAMVAGIAQRAVNNGYESLTPRQKAVLVPFLTKPCDGVTDPGGYHNDCQHVLEGDDLENAIQNDMYYGGLLCPSCVDEKEEHRRQWENIQRQ
ncbi:hypothetical protein [Enterobacter roggenkampii]|uniref:hypothetical protein n=1 Tax=Enterobacter roggenkampii TaxID=1812935 RepID=UPI001659FDE6|nr:hypothetical protein [Enterobacter roggenkampii]EKT6267682.1 hypothetical protein [Escherichia coli]MCM7332678.1 hypothetical protein [Enterobacter roggenkampii]QNQ31368.1 hypothetical protein H9W87_09785 [Enterobacter roggenkampii]HDP9916992.1 hypothetical protein [Escherichia coli]HDQ1248785.1 hypothetical protein [Escherichia coli]